MMTKDEERAVLEQINELISSTGEDSYISMAFEGCVSLAWGNIENDFGCSPLDYKREAEQLREDLKAKSGELSAALEQLDSTRAELTEAWRKTPSEAIKNDMFNLLLEGMDYYESEMKTAAANIVALADDPTSEAFKRAVYLNRMYAEKANKCDMLTDYLKSI